MTSQKQISLFTEEQLTSSPGDSPASRIQQQGSGLAKKMNATCGRKCLEQYEKFSHVGLWAKTFSALLIGMEGWYSKRCKLIWKLKGTKSNRMYFQLRPLTLHTEGIESGLLPTPLAQAREQTNFEAYDQRMERLKEKGHKPFTMPLDQMALKNGIITRMGEQSSWDNFPTQSPIRTRNDGLPTKLDGITCSKWRTESIKAGGNAILPQVVYQIFKAIHTFETKNLKP